jgi:DNA-directed RNA polymerase alpha subunit
MNEYKSVEEIFQSIENFGLLSTLRKYFGNEYEMELPFYDEARNASIEELNLSVRSFNCMKRAGIDTVGKCIRVIKEDGLLNIRNLGRKSVCEINAKIREFGYAVLPKSQQKEFIQATIRLNNRKK